MSMTDPMADMITRIRNAGMASHAKLDVPSSNAKVAVATVLKELGYVKNLKVISDNKQGILRIIIIGGGPGAEGPFRFTGEPRPSWGQPSRP